MTFFIKRPPPMEEQLRLAREWWQKHPQITSQTPPEAPAATRDEETSA